MRPRRGGPLRFTPVAALIVALPLSGCAAVPIDHLPTAGAAEPTAVLEVVTPSTTGETEAVQVPLEVPSDPLSVFRAVENECLRHANLVARGAADQPRVEPERFTGATVIQDLDAGTTLIEDGLGARLVITDWRSYPTIRAATGRAEDLPPSYRLACPTERFPD